MKDCNSCIHQRVCSLKGKYEDYKKEMEALMKKWGDEKENPFGFSMNCPEWHEKINVGITRNDKPKSDLDIWIEQERNMHPPLVKKIKEGEREPRITYSDKTDLDKPKFKEIPMPNVKPCKEESKHTGYEEFRDGKMSSLSCDVEDEIMATKEPEEDDLDVQIVYYEGQPIAKITHKKDTTKEDKKEYDFVKELEKALGFQIRMDSVRGL